MTKEEIKNWLDTADSMVGEIKKFNSQDDKLQKLANKLQKSVHRLERHLEIEPEIEQIPMTTDAVRLVHYIIRTLTDVRDEYGTSVGDKEGLEEFFDYKKILVKLEKLSAGQITAVFQGVQGATYYSQQFIDLMIGQLFEVLEETDTDKLELLEELLEFNEINYCL